MHALRSARQHALDATESTQRRPRRASRLDPRILMVIAVSLAALSACSSPSGSEGSDESRASEGTQVSPAPTQPPTHASADGAPLTSASSRIDSAAGGGDKGIALEDAAATAREQLPGSTVVSIESEANGSRWEVKLVTGDGAEHELDVSSTEGRVIGSPSRKQEDAVDRKEHRNRVSAAKVDYRKAAAKLRGAVPGARITELNIDTEQGITVWEASVLDDAGTKHAVTINAGNGKVLTNAMDAGS